MKGSGNGGGSAGGLRAGWEIFGEMGKMGDGGQFS